VSGLTDSEERSQDVEERKREEEYGSRTIKDVVVWIVGLCRMVW